MGDGDGGGVLVGVVFSRFVRFRLCCRWVVCVLFFIVVSMRRFIVVIFWGLVRRCRFFFTCCF